MEAEKALGNEKFKAGDFPAAIEHFSKALDIQPTHVLYSNRSACYCSLRKCVTAASPRRRPPQPALAPPAATPTLMKLTVEERG